MKTQQDRFLELDLWRGLAIIGMVIFHTAFLLDYFDITSVAYYAGGWHILARLVQWSFFLLVGIGVHLSYHRSRDRGESHLKFLKKNTNRAFLIFMAGLGITFASALAFPQDVVLFGVLHFLGLSIFLLGFVANKPQLAVVLSFVVYWLTFVTSSIETHQLNLLMLGIYPADFRTLDYFPLIPWLSIPLIGIFIGSVLYPHGKRRHRKLIPHRATKPVLFLGRNALLVYLVHVPILAILISQLKNLI